MASSTGQFGKSSCSLLNELSTQRYKATPDFSEPPGSVLGGFQAIVTITTPDGPRTFQSIGSFPSKKQARESAAAAALSALSCGDEASRGEADGASDTVSVQMQDRDSWNEAQQSKVSRLNLMCQQKYKIPPSFTAQSEIGGFTASVTVDNYGKMLIFESTGIFQNKKSAKESAAAEALRHLERDGVDVPDNSLQRTDEGDLGQQVYPQSEMTAQGTSHGMELSAHSEDSILGDGGSLNGSSDSRGSVTVSSGRNSTPNPIQMPDIASLFNQRCQGRFKVNPIFTVKQDDGGFVGTVMIKTRAGETLTFSSSGSFPNKRLAKENATAKAFEEVFATNISFNSESDDLIDPKTAAVQVNLQL